MGTLLQDLRYGLRMHWKAIGTTLIMVATLALGVGAGATVFSVINTVLLKRLPYQDPQRIMMVWRLAPIGSLFGNESYPWSPRDFKLFHESSNSLQDLAAFRSRRFNFTGSGEPDLFGGLQVSAGFFSALGVLPATGRTFTLEEDQPGHEQVVVLSYELWRNRFGGNSGIVGRTINLNGLPYVVIGIMPAGFSFPRAEEMPSILDLPRSIQLWTPMALPASPRGPDELGVIARLKPGMTMAQAQEDANVFQKRLESQFSQEKGWLCRLVPLQEQVVGSIRQPLLLVMGAVALFLLAACSNIANLLLARAIERRQEFSLRAALGAGQGRLVRQLLAENFLLTLLGGAAGVLLAEVGLRLLKAFGPADLPRLQEVGIDLQVLLFSLAVTLLSGFLFGLAPALAAARQNLVGSLKQGRQGLSGANTARTRNSLAVAQVTLALVLVIAAGLLVRTFFRMLRTNAGFNPEHVISFEVSLPTSKYSDLDHIIQTYQRMLEQLHSLAGVEHAGLTSVLPMAGPPDSTVIRVPGFSASSDKERPYANYSFASPGYFSAIGAPLLQGRDFVEADKADSIPVTIVNHALARKFWPKGDALGKQVGVANPRWPVRTIVGVIADVKRASLREEVAPEMYVPYTQNEIKIWPSMQTMQFALRTQADPNSLVENVRTAIHSIDSDLPVADVATLTYRVAESLVQPRFSMLLLGSFGVLALLLASIGIYGVISYSVRQRGQEIGIRMALGAERKTIFRMVLMEGGRLAGIGILIGITASFALTRLMASFLYGVKAADPLTFSAVPLFLFVIALIASYVPARRATRVDPIIALRCE